MSTCRDCFGSGYGNHPDSGQECWTCGGSGDGDVRYVPCDHCGTEGRIITMRGNDPDTERDRGPCPTCEGTGRMAVAVSPVTLDDIVSIPTL